MEKAQRDNRAAAAAAEKETDRERLQSKAADPFKPKDIEPHPRRKATFDQKDLPPMGAVAGFQVGLSRALCGDQPGRRRTTASGWEMLSLHWKATESHWAAGMHCYDCRTLVIMSR